MTHHIPAARILLAEADEITRAFLADNLTADGYTVVPAATEQAALAELEHGDVAVDLLLVDVNGHTLALLDTVRARDDSRGGTPADVPVIVLSSHTAQLHRTRLLERGADDVVAKPFSYGELRARIAAVLRRTSPRPPAAVLRAGPVRIDRHQHHVTVHERPVHLSSTEYRLLCVLAEEPERVFTRDELMRTVWGYSSSHTRTLDSHAHRLRRKLSADMPVVVNCWGVGYALIPRAQVA